MGRGDRVICILRKNHEVLLRRESTDHRLPNTTVGDAPGGGSGNGAPTAARLADDLVEGAELVRRGDPIDHRGTTIHPFLFDCTGRKSAGREWTWGPPTVLLEGSDADRTWPAYERIAPTVKSVENDTDHGSAYLSLRALEVLRDRAAFRARHGSAGTWSELIGTAIALLEARPAMAVVKNRINRAMSRASDERTAGALTTAATDTLAAAVAADSEASRRAANRVHGRSVITISRSGTVLGGLLDGEPSAATVLESRPAREGVGVAERLGEAGIPTTLIIDAAAAHFVTTREPDVVLVGADTVLATGGVVNKVGTRTLATVAHRAGIPVIAVASTDKIDAKDVPTFEAGPPADLYRGDVAISVYNPLFDHTPAALVDALVTEAGVLEPEAVNRIAEAHERRARWRTGTDR